MLAESLRTLVGAVLHTVWVLAGGIVLAILGMFAWLRLWGVPESWQVQVKSALEARDIHLRYKKAFLDGTGALVITQGRWVDPDEPGQTLLQFSRLVVRVAWLSWWRDEPFLRRIDLRDAEVAFPVGSEIIEVDDVRASVDLLPESIRIQELHARILGIDVKVHGDHPMKNLRLSALLNERRPSGPGLNPDQIAAGWRSAKDALGKIEFREPALLEVALGAAREGSTSMAPATVTFTAPSLHFQSIEAASVVARVEVGQGRARLSNFSARLGSGELRATATADLEARRGEGAIDSTVDPAWLARSAGATNALARVRFGRPPVTHLRTIVTWTNGFEPLVMADLDWRHIRMRGSQIDRVTASLASAPGRLFIPEGTLQQGTNRIEFSWIMDKPRALVRGSWRGTLDPGAIKAWLPEGAQPFMNSCQFTRPVASSFQLEGTNLSAGAFELEGALDVREALYKGVAIKRLATELATDGRILRFTDVILEKPEGRGVSPELRYDLKNRVLTLEQVRLQLNVQETAHLFGGNFEKYCRPYVFRAAPDIRVNGTADLGGGPKTDVRVAVKGRQMTYPFLGVLLPFDSVDTEFAIRGDRLTIGRFRGAIHDGWLTGGAKFHLIAPRPTFVADLKVSDMDFNRVMQNLFEVSDVSGIVNGECSIRGTVDEFRSLIGSGGIQVKEGNLKEIPFMGALSAVLSAVVPRLGHETATDAVGSYQIRDGKVATDDLEMHGNLFTIICDGNYDFVDNDLDMDARVNVRGPVGLAFYPVSKLFEYHGSGPLKETVWRPKILE